MQKKQIKIPIVLIFFIVIIIVISLLIIFSCNKNKNNDNDNENSKVTDFNARKENFEEWNNVVAINEIPEYKGKGNLKQQTSSGNTAVVIYTGVNYEDAKIYYETILQSGFISENGNFSLIYGIATDNLIKNKSNYKYRITYNEDLSELSIKGTDGEL